MQNNNHQLTDTAHRSASTGLPHTRLSTWLDGFLIGLGNAFSWLWVVLMLVIIINVLMRYLFGEGRIEFEELQWHLYALGWLVGLSYCMVTDSHVRVDLLRDRFSLRTQAKIELFGMIILLFPFLILVFWYAIPFFLYSWELGEVSAAPGGLPFRWFMKSALLFAFALLAIAAISRMSRVCAFLFSPTQTSPEETQLSTLDAEKKESSSWK
ncbi:TRAP transporter small permease subunit [Enterovibrio sp. ZSDZ35]|uniref:TRAP transporter small permease protein n=1 Tax=Enterovibrio qingdaonensis TaxID=2899818 RepID=A0ABT5QU53_9GAMM|nr:TRAP transporter small permease subunit [Enterovibrio sp. ZSDZ35]MDD1784248.1 TRAP transporter small permease subunit [Enterovibrio sp. ZSDZ35]